MVDDGKFSDGTLLLTAAFLYPTHEAPYDYRRTTHLGPTKALTRHGLEVVDVAAQGEPFLLVGPYLLPRCRPVDLARGTSDAGHRQARGWPLPR